MLIEQTLEATIATKLAALTALADAEVIASRSPSAAGFVKGETDTDAKQVIAVSLGLRQHDNFTLPTVNISGSVAISTRAELCPTGAEHETAVEAIAKLFSDWHRDGSSFSTDTSIANEFFSAELRMDGGSGKTFDDQRGIWTESISFTIRGTLLESTNN